MSRKRMKQILAVAVLLVTAAAFVYYIRTHPETVRQLTRVPLQIVAGLLLLYAVFQLTLAWIQRATLNLCDIRLGRGESTLLVMYSSIINFFGPLQSGPAFRAAYLKRKHAVSLRKYAVATLLHYGFYAAFSGLFILAYFFGLWILAGVVLILGAAPILHRFAGLLPAKFRSLKLRHVGNLAAATLAQVTTLALIFYVELNSLGRHVGAVADLIYTGAANFALFVSLTPGAIGFRESFLIFSQRLHQISLDQIAAASLIDRGVYVVFLGVLAAIIFGFHAQNYLKPRDDKDQS